MYFAIVVLVIVVAIFVAVVCTNYSVRRKKFAQILQHNEWMQGNVTRHAKRCLPPCALQQRTT